MEDNIFNNSPLAFTTPLSKSIELKYLLRKVPTKGNIVYEYNPFRNYRLDEDMYEYKNHLYTLEELKTKFNITTDGNSWSENLGDEAAPILIEAGSLVDFETNQLQFDLQHPVDIIPQYSYDGSVNLILNDGKNIPRLINSRFTTLSKNTYEVKDRKGNNDTNIYDRGSQFDIDTSLYKRVVEIPELEFLGVRGGGNLKAGNYVFYFKYADADGNETDFVAESGLVSLFIGTDLDSVRQGIRDENTYKSVRFFIYNIDSGYSYVSVYYTRVSGDVDGNPSKTAHRINKKFEINKSLCCTINISGFEDITDIPISDINIQYNIAQSVEAQAACQNMLFLGNIHRPDINYKELTDLSLRFLPIVDTSKKYSAPKQDYQETSKNTYVDPSFIYNYTGYMNGEIYHLGIVYILADNSLSPVFNIRGRNNINTDTNNLYNSIPVFQKKNNEIQYDGDGNPIRIYISSDEQTGEIISNELYENFEDKGELENAWGVVKLQQPHQDAWNDSNTIYGIKIKLDHGNEVLQCLKKLNIKGFFFVRQKRIPLRLCQALTIGLEKQSCTPVLPVSYNTIRQYKNKSTEGTDKLCYITERFLNDDKKLVEDFISRTYIIDTNNVEISAAICPEYDVNPQYFNQLFTGSKFYITQANFKPADEWLSLESQASRHFYSGVPVNNNSADPDTAYPIDIVGVPDDVSAIIYQNQKYRSRAGEAEEAWRFQYLEYDNKVKDAFNIVRGSYGPYLGIDGYNKPCSIININSPDYVDMNIRDKFEVRHADKTPYYAISKRYALKDFSNFTEIEEPLYRGDSFICTFTHRFNRNFQDPEAPTNDQIVDPDTWADNYTIDKKEELAKINRGDVNAVPLGMWVTFTLVSSMNLNIRALDPSFPTEEGLTGHKRGFHPYYPASTEGSFKMPESFVHNGGYNMTVGEKYNFILPDVPYIKNEFVTRILYSDIHINDAFKNGFRVFQLSHYRDYPRTYGSIIKLVELNGNLLCVFEHGVALIPVNERAVAGEGSGGNVFINTSNVLPENPRVLSDMYGSQWSESVIKTPYYVYGVDTIGKKIWRTNGQKFEIISDFKIQKFLNDNISLTERELTPIIGIRNVKTHYNAFKQDVMFTFYDNLSGFYEKVWNICYNEILEKWITFYSWVPSYSANIDNIFFSFNRDTSKYISKLGISKENSDFAEGIVLSENIFTVPPVDGDDATIGEVKIGKLSLKNVQLPQGINNDPSKGIVLTYTWSLERDNEQNYKYFEIRGKNVDPNDSNSPLEYYLYLKAGIAYEDYRKHFLANIFSYNPDTHRRVLKNPNDEDYNDRLVALLNIKCNIDLKYTGTDNNIKYYSSGWTENKTLDYGDYQTVVAVMPKENEEMLTTDFWKHGQAGIIDIKDKIKPTLWYSKQHPFEFEFVVVDNPQFHKIFNNLQIVSNKAKPESFHYEIVGESYDFAPEKKNIFIRQEMIKDFYQYNGSDILYDKRFLELTPKQNVKSTLFPLYYSRQDKANTIEDYYRLHEDWSSNNTLDAYYGINTPNKDFVNLSGTEVVYDELLNEFRLWIHAKAYDIAERGRIRGNMHYLEDLWDIQINPIVFVQKNEVWGGTYRLTRGYYYMQYDYYQVSKATPVEQTTETGETQIVGYNLTWTRRTDRHNPILIKMNDNLYNGNEVYYDIQCNTTAGKYIKTAYNKGLYYLTDPNNFDGKTSLIIDRPQNEMDQVAKSECSLSAGARNTSYCSVNQLNNYRNKKEFISAKVDTSTDGFDLMWDNFISIETRMPISIGNTPIPSDLQNFNSLEIYPTDEYTEPEMVDKYMPKDIREFIDDKYTWKDIDTTNWSVFPARVNPYSEYPTYPSGNSRKEAKIKDKYLKVRVRYSGEELAVIAALKTLFTISYA